MTDQTTPHVLIIGAGFCGLAAGYELSKSGLRVTILEEDSAIGGLAGSFQVNGAQVEKFYHHWFTSDKHVMALISELGKQDKVVFQPTRTGMYYANNVFRLSSPIDLLRFTPLSITDRIRLGLVALRARRVKEWRQLENLTAAEWLRQIGGDRVYGLVWEPLLRGKFGDYASEISAVWFWNKLKLRGGSRRRGREVLAYYAGGFAALAEEIASRIREFGGEIYTDSPAVSLNVEGAQIVEVCTPGASFKPAFVLATPALPIIADLLQPYASDEYLSSLRRIKYLANVCLILRLDRSLSTTYWLNVNDIDFPFVGVIEHTNFVPASFYTEKIVYLSKYLPEDHVLFQASDADFVSLSLPFLTRMFPAFSDKWILHTNIWRARYAQPIVERNYNDLVPGPTTPFRNLRIATMAQIYPEDRGTNYAIRQGKDAARQIVKILQEK